MSRSPWRSLLRYWALSLMLSVVLVAAGDRWPQPLPVQPALALALVLLPAVAVLLWLALNWSLPGAGPGDTGESHHSEVVEF
ncbi:MAG: hypothetical protein VKM98_04220 [Cyanobacteriota bacterium]|nr:hypothetical protein [Cyanobacteriota bacterium]